MEADHVESKSSELTQNVKILPQHKNGTKPWTLNWAYPGSVPALSLSWGAAMDVF